MSNKLNVRLAEFISNQSEVPSKKELEAAVKAVYNDKKKQEKEDKVVGGEKPKRKPSAYNLFYAEQSAILKENEADKKPDEKMTAKAKMQYIAALWKSKNGTEPELEDE